MAIYASTTARELASIFKMLFQELSGQSILAGEIGLTDAQDLDNWCPLLTLSITDALLIWL